MAVAMDLGNKSSIYGSVHPPDKQDVGFRLALAGRAIAYGDLDVYYSGPIVSDVTFTWKINSTVWMTNVKYHHESVGQGGIEVRSVHGFQVRKLALSHNDLLYQEYAAYIIALNLFRPLI